ncbi:MAG: GGDEF domain-containing protein [Actinomycetota bacterium]|nr:GGDEF domain-containing protein [Actinomycetota bacterium]
MSAADDEQPAVGGLPFADFRAASLAVLQQLRQHLGLRMWAVSRVAGAEQVFLTAETDASAGYPDATGLVVPWVASLCAPMVAGAGPTVAARVEEVPVYAEAPARAAFPIGAYAGAPLRLPDGALFGTVCGFDPQPQPASVELGAPLLDLQARLLSTVLTLELAQDRQRQRAERAEAEAAVDPLTGLANRRAWDRLLAVEEARCTRYGHPAAVLVLDLNDLKQVNDTSGHAGGDALLRRTAALLRAHTRPGDLVARLGGDEFAVLAVHTDALGAAAETDRLRSALASSGVDAAIGAGVRTAAGTLTDAWVRADHAMYTDKRRAHQLGSRAVGREQPAGAALDG